MNLALELHPSEPSAGFTITFASLSPGVVVSTGVSYSNFVPFGNSGTLPMESSAFGVSPTLTVWSLTFWFVAIRLGRSLRDMNPSLELHPSSHLDRVTITFASLSPGVVVSTGVFVFKTSSFLLAILERYQWNLPLLVFLLL